MAEGVDRLELVADVEDLLLDPGGDEIDEVALERVRVLELVDHDRAEPQLLGLSHPRVRGEEIAGEQLQVLEVERRLALLGGAVLGGEQVEELLEKVAIAGGGVLERRLLDALARLLEPGRARPSSPERGKVDQRLGKRGKVERGTRRLGLSLGRAGIVEQPQGGLAERLEAAAHIGGLAQLEHQRPPGGAQRLVDACQHLPQPAAPVHGEEPGALRLVDRAERLQRMTECLAAEHGSVLVVELVEPRVDPDGERMRAQQAGAEAVDRGDPRPVELTGEIGPPARGEGGTDARTQLPCGLARVGDDQDRADVEPLVAHGANEPLDEHRRLPRAGAGGHEHLAARLDRRALLVVHAHARGTLHIVQRSHQLGHSPPFGSWATSPTRIRRAAESARSRAVSTWPQNCSSSR